MSSDFLTFDQPTFPGVFQELLYGVKKSYGETVLQTVMQVGQEDEDDIVLLVNYFLPELANTLAKQRRDYGLDPEIFPAQFPIAEQAEAIEHTPTNNMDMERLMGKADQRLKKLQTLNATCRTITLQKTEQVRKQSGKTGAFRSYKQKIEARRQLEMQWNARQQDRFRTQDYIEYSLQT